MTFISTVLHLFIHVNDHYCTKSKLIMHVLGWISVLNWR
uniref:Uncharacterized protein n=1 Tax=Arundo donax TaxID=35708 RepID=A0A0A8ZX81_ARUDO